MRSFGFAFSGSFAQRFTATAGLLVIVAGCYGTPTHGKGKGGAGGASGTGGAAGAAGLAGGAGTTGTGGLGATGGSAEIGGKGGAGGTGGNAGSGGTSGAGATGGGAGSGGTSGATGASGNTGGAGRGGAGGTGGSAGTTGTAGAGGTGGSCAAPNTQCPAVCTNLATDANNCTSCGNICLPPPANGHAICQAAAGCGIQCDSGHLKCGSTCCDTAPANATAICSAGSTCGVQCNSGNHACTGTSSSCYDDTDVTHCGPNCTDCRQPNATAVCTGTQCANICNGTTLSCPGTGGHVVCGTWDFESGTTEGWTNMGDIGVDVSGGKIEASSIRAALGSYSLAVGHNDTAAISAAGGGFSTFAVHLCPSGIPISLNGKLFSFSMYLAPTTGGDLNAQFNLEFYMVLRNGQNVLGDIYLDGGYTGTIMPFPANQWFNVSSGPLTNIAVTDIEIAFRTYNDPWVGTVFFDHIRIE